MPENLGRKKAHIISIQGPLGVFVCVCVSSCLSSCLFPRVSSDVSDSLCISIVNVSLYVSWFSSCSCTRTTPGKITCSMR